MTIKLGVAGRRKTTIESVARPPESEHFLRLSRHQVRADPGDSGQRHDARHDRSTRKRGARAKRVRHGRTPVGWPRQAEKERKAKEKKKNF